jgi:RNA polymerase sigma-70 factor (ECF subfamily)
MVSAAVPGADREQRLEQWITKYADAVLRTCFVYLSDAALAEDAMQDTFLKAWRGMDTFEGRNGCSEKTWLMRIAINVCHGYRRLSWFRHVDLTRALETLPASCQAILPEDRTLFLDILRLPEKYKQVILLYYYQDMTLEEAAQALLISRSATHHRLKRAQELLRLGLTGEGSR